MKTYVFGSFQRKSRIQLNSNSMESLVICSGAAGHAARNLLILARSSNMRVLVMMKPQLDADFAN